MCQSQDLAALEGESDLNHAFTEIKRRKSQGTLLSNSEVGPLWPSEEKGAFTGIRCGVTFRASHHPQKKGNPSLGGNSER